MAIEKCGIEEPLAKEEIKTTEVAENSIALRPNFKDLFLPCRLYFINFSESPKIELYTRDQTSKI